MVKTGERSQRQRTEKGLKIKRTREKRRATRSVHKVPDVSCDKKSTRLLPGSQTSQRMMQREERKTSHQDDGRAGVLVLHVSLWPVPDPACAHYVFDVCSFVFFFLSWKPLGVHLSQDQRISRTVRELRNPNTVHAC